MLISLSWTDIVFLITFFITLLFFHYANGKSKILTLAVIGWSIMHALLAANGFYQITSAMPPRLTFILIPSILVIIYGLLPQQRQWLYTTRNFNISTILHTIRIPIEMVLLQLYLIGLVPMLMTFEGRNFDIIIGISAIFIGILWLKRKLSKRVLLIWNIIGLGFVCFILINGVLSAELPFQQFAFDQPNKAVTLFPYVLLPATIVPIVIWTHLADIFTLLNELNHTVLKES